LSFGLTIYINKDPKLAEIVGLLCQSGRLWLMNFTLVVTQVFQIYPPWS